METQRSNLFWMTDSTTYSYHKEVYVYDGFCTPFMNNEQCAFDGGDCCLPYVDTHQRCGLGEDCTCHWTRRRHPTYKDGKHYTLFKNSKICPKCPKIDDSDFQNFFVQNNLHVMRDTIVGQFFRYFEHNYLRRGGAF